MWRQWQWQRMVWLFTLGSAACVPAAVNRAVDEGLANPALAAGAEPSPGTTAPAVDLAQPLTRAALTALALARDPGISARAHRARALLHDARAEGALPPPEVSAEVWNLPLARPYALGEAQMYMLEARQMLPAAGASGARARAMLEDARGELSELAAREQDVTARVANAYADYLGAELDHRVHGEHLALLEAMRDAARARIPTGTSALTDVARIETELARTRRAMARVEGEVARARAALNALLLRAGDAPLGPPADLEPETVPDDAAPLLARATEFRGENRRAESRARAAAALAEAARDESRWPVFTLALSYWQDPRLEPGFGTSVAMTLPWLWGGGRERALAAVERAAAERDEARAADADARGQVSTALARVRGLERELAVLRDDARPAAVRSVEAVREAYVTGRADLLAWLDAARQVLDVEAEQAEVVANLARAVAELERAAGTTLPRRPVAANTERAP